ncbi:hypothetical protein [Enterobacter quasiroggenkampii]|uniref:hypothetical protein n=1 Tax=Enterobacter quasiroggenkampii TaxID=2497436 RepID=UPI0039C42232
MSDDLLDKKIVIEGSNWIKSNFGNEILNSFNGTIFDLNLACAIACKETLYFWYNIRNDYPAEFILGRCILDGNGDIPGTTRNPFPRNTDEFRAVYGDEITSMLIMEANKTRNIRGYKDAQWVYKGYGIFQYDLQHIQSGDEDFFIQKKWYSIENCVDKLSLELQEKSYDTDDLHTIVKRYNGSGASANNYADQVMIYYGYLS